MFPLKKEPCSVDHVISETDCPPFDVLINPLDYPKYFNALYFPDLHPHVFASANSLCSWLNDIFSGAISDSSMTVSCVHTSFCNGIFLVQSESLGSMLALSLGTISNRNFHPQKLLKYFVPLLYASPNPRWFYFSDEHYLLSLCQLSGSVLKDSIRTCLLHQPINSMTKDFVSRLLLGEFHRLRLSMLGMSDYELLQNVIVSQPIQLPLKKHMVLFQHFSLHFGVSVATAFLVPESDSSHQILHENAELLEDLLENSQNNTPVLKSSKMCSKKHLIDCLKRLHPSRQFSGKQSFNTLRDAVVESYQQMLIFLISQ